MQNLVSNPLVVSGDELDIYGENKGFNGFIYHLMTGKGRQEAKLCYHNYSKEERIEIGRQYFLKWNLQSYSKIKLKEQYTDLEIKYSS